MDHCNPLLKNTKSPKKFITMGEIMLRLTPPNYEKIRMASSFEASYGGSEANIALALANLGIDSTFFTVVPNNSLGKSALGEWKRSRICAYILLLVNLSLSGAVLMILFSNRGYDYPGILIYVMAMYTFYSTIHAIVDIVKYRSLGSPVMTTAKIVSLSAALVSMLNLETAMFAQFGKDMAQQDQNLMIILTGAGISITVVTLSVILIVKATKVIRREKYGK